MPFIIGFSPRNTAEINTGEAATAAAALTEVENLKRSDEEIRFIKTPEGRQIEIWELKELAQREGKK